jgi:hypothetical protein
VVIRPLAKIVYNSHSFLQSPSLLGLSPRVVRLERFFTAYSLAPLFFCYLLHTTFGLLGWRERPSFRQAEILFPPATSSCKWPQIISSWVFIGRSRSPSSELSAHAPDKITNNRLRLYHPQFAEGKRFSQNCSLSNLCPSAVQGLTGLHYLNADFQDTEK